MMKLFVGNIPHRADENEIGEFFNEFFVVSKVILVKDKVTGHSRGFGFVEFDETLMPEFGIEKIIKELNGIKMNGRPLTVNKAHPEVPKQEHKKRFERE